MSRLPQARQGERIKLNELLVDFSFYPTHRVGRRESSQSRLFASDPWVIMQQSITNSSNTRKSKSEALSFLTQGTSYFEAAQNARDISAMPLLLYYSFMNAVKAFILHTRIRSNLDLTVQHGIREQSGAVKGDLTGANLRAFPSSTTGTNINLFDDFLKAIAGAGLTAQKGYKLLHLIRQMLPGHRLWCSATRENERFIHVSEIFYMKDDNSTEIWLNIKLSKPDLRNAGISHKAFLEQANIAGQMSLVNSAEVNEISLQLDNTMQCARSPLDKLAQLSAILRPQLWTSVLSHPPYRRHYFHLSRPKEQNARLPQLLSIYSVIYYLSSIARYRPYHFDKLLNGKYGSLLNSVMVDQPQQFLFLLASEFAQQEVTRAAIL